VNAFLLYHPKTRPTGRALAKLIGIPSGTACGAKYANISHIIRWGSQREVSATWEAEHHPYVRFRNRIFVNDAGALAKAGNKYKSLEIMRKAGVSVPEFVKAGQRGNLEYPMLGRAFRHSRGTDIEIIDGVRPIKDAPYDYFIQYIKPHKEYRVHVVGDKVLFAQKKYFREQLFHTIVCDKFFDSDYAHDWRVYNEGYKPLEEFEEESQFIRNNDHGWGFHDMEDIGNVPTDVLAQAILSVKSLGLDFGAVDIITSEERVDGKHKPFVLEVNTAPGLRDRNLVKYARHFKQLIGE
jgi:hypothetical protein